MTTVNCSLKQTPTLVMMLEEIDMTSIVNLDYKFPDRHMPMQLELTAELLQDTPLGYFHDWVADEAAFLPRLNPEEELLWERFWHHPHDSNCILLTELARHPDSSVSLAIAQFLGFYGEHLRKWVVASHNTKFWRSMVPKYGSVHGGDKPWRDGHG